MVTTLDLKKALGKKAENLSDEELSKLNYLFERISDALFEAWIKQTSPVQDK